MLTLSQKLPDYFEYIENDVSYSLRQVQYPQDIPLLHAGCMSHTLFLSGN